MCYTNCLNLEELKKYGQVIINHYCNCCCKCGETDPVNPPEKPTQPTDPVEPIEEDVKWSVENSPDADISEDGLTATMSSHASGQYLTIATKILSVGKWYWEIEFTQGKTMETGVVLLQSDNSKIDKYRGYYGYSGNKVKNVDGSIVSEGYGSTYSTNTIGVAVDLDKGTLEFFKDGMSQGVAFNDINILKSVCPYTVNRTTGGAGAVTAVAHFKRSSFKYPIPEGFKPYAEV